MLKTLSCMPKGGFHSHFSHWRDIRQEIVEVVYFGIKCAHCLLQLYDEPEKPEGPQEGQVSPNCKRNGLL